MDIIIRQILISTFLAVVIVTSTHAASLTLVSGPSPYAACTVGGPGVNYVNAEVEPWIATNPANEQNVIGTWQQDRWSNGGSHGLVAGFSFDGGATWGTTTLPFSRCAGGVDYERASDPWVSIGPDGTAYAIAISFNQSNNNNAVTAVTSSNGGQTWQNLNIIIANNEPTTQFFNDKESVTADPNVPGVAYAVWDRLELPNGNPYADLHTAAYRGPTFFSKTIDGGRTWSTPQVIVDTPSRQQTIGNQIVVDRSGTLYNFFNRIKPPFNITASNVAFIKSTDGGTTWTKPQIIAQLRTVGVTHPNTGQEVRTGDIIPEPAIDPNTGQLYVVWQDSRFNGGHYDEVALSTSTNGGTTWSNPIRVNTATGRPAFTPSVHVSSQGVIGVSYYDFRSLATETTTLPTDYWLTTSSNGGVSFGNEAHIAGSFDMATAPDAGGFFVGDYEGLTTIGGAFLPFFVQTNSGNTANRTDVYSTTVTP
ncbi:MAG: exo-alpha-sialidase [Gammaproteobacteria bacterium]|nr:exo-alpha-sialidase [Gammaproteobacteria bacterium]